MSQRSKDLASQFAHAKSRQSMKNELELGNRKVLDKGFEEISKDLKSSFASQCDDLNHEPEIGNILVANLDGSNCQITRTDTGGVLHILFDDATHAITMKCDQPAKFKQVVQVKLTTNEQGYWYADGTGSGIGTIDTSGYLANKALSAFLGIP